MNSKHGRAFTIVELLVVVSIIALLIGILLPAIGKARDQARLTISQTNLRQLGQAHATYSAEWNDRQFTLVDDSIGRYGGSAGQALPSFLQQNGSHHPPILLGWTTGNNGAYGLYGFYMSWGGNHDLVEPISFTDSFGWFRIPNAKQFNTYLNGRFYDPVFYAPKDRIPMTMIEPHLDHPGEYVDSETIGGSGPDTYVWSSYCLSPAALYGPSVLAYDEETNLAYRDPWLLDGGFRVPTLGQARYPELKTHMLEHHWLQQTRADCNPGLAPGTYDGCEPYYFNLAFESVPMTLFYDGHVQGLGVREARAASKKAEAQSGYGLWSRDTPLGDNGYFQDISYDNPSGPDPVTGGTSFHILTVDGILGRDKTK